MGAFGESAALTHMTRQGYTLRERNWRCSLGEIDLIANDGEQVVFVEVRTRRNAAPGSPEESISRAKQERLIDLAYAYIEAHSLEASISWRIDVIAIVLDRAGRIVSLNHIPNAIEQRS